MPALMNKRVLSQIFPIHFLFLAHLSKTNKRTSQNRTSAFSRLRQTFLPTLLVSLATLWTLPILVQRFRPLGRSCVTLIRSPCAFLRRLVGGRRGNFSATRRRIRVVLFFPPISRGGKLFPPSPASSKLLLLLPPPGISYVSMCLVIF
jgi:hypothetical protein